MYLLYSTNITEAEEKYHPRDLFFPSYSRTTAPLTQHIKRKVHMSTVQRRWFLSKAYQEEVEELQWQATDLPYTCIRSLRQLFGSGSDTKILQLIRIRRLIRNLPDPQLCF